MKNLILLVSLIMLECKSEKDPLEGEWKVNSQFYTAICKIEKEDKYLSGMALSYNDGTSIYKFSEDQPRYFFKKLQRKGSHYIDGVSGATKSTAHSNQVRIELISSDTLKMISKVSNRPIEELWIRN